jgi:hypothetical protein
VAGKAKPVVSLRKPPSADAVAAFVAKADDAPAAVKAPATKAPKRKATKLPSHQGAEARAMTLRLPAGLYRELAHACVDRDITLTAALAEGARLWLAKR